MDEPNRLNKYKTSFNKSIQFVKVEHLMDGLNFFLKKINFGLMNIMILW